MHSNSLSAKIENNKLEKKNKNKIQQENMFCVAVKHARRLSKRVNKKPTYVSSDDEDDLVRTSYS